MVKGKKLCKSIWDKALENDKFNEFIENDETTKKSHMILFLVHLNKNTQTDEYYEKNNQVKQQVKRLTK